MKIEIRILDPRLESWGFPAYGSALAAGLDLHACVDGPLILSPQAPAKLVPAGFALSIGDPEWCGLILPRSGSGHRHGLVLGNAVGLIDADYEGMLMISAWNRNPGRSGDPQNTGAGQEPGMITINPGDRIAQLVVTRIARPRFEIVTRFSRSGGRGDAGFGSTGTGAAPVGAKRAD